jgi:hypothetical protein
MASHSRCRSATVAPMDSRGFVGIPALASHPFAYPLLEALHIVGVALLVGNLVLLELRVWGHGAALPILPLARLALAISLSGFALLGATGLLMFAAAPNEMLTNRAFVLKMGLIMLSGLNAAWFHARHGLQLMDRMARAQTALSLGLWLAVIICGRWIAYA